MLGIIDIFLVFNYWFTLAAFMRMRILKNNPLSGGVVIISIS